MIVVRKLISYTIVLTAFFAGCSSIHEIRNNEITDQPAATEYSVIYYIHADAGYLYHDSDGQPVRANSRVLDTAFEVAEKAQSGEVFIFYQRPEKTFLGLFPRKSSRFYHYTNGEKTTQVKYRHSGKNEPFLTTEARLYKKYRNYTPQKDPQHYLLYYGHEIPNDEGTNYHRTLPDIKVNTASFTDGIQQFFTKEDQIFDLLVLSTCNNGTPEMASLLMPFTDYLLASPQNLHLSHIDSDKMALLESKSAPSPKELGHSMARQTYRRLAENIQTTITLALYDLDLIRPYINELHTSAKAYEPSARTNLFQDNVDCKQFTFFDAEKYTAGIDTWYKPAKFGKGATDSTMHSGWGCEPVSKN